MIDTIKQAFIKKGNKVIDFDDLNALVDIKKISDNNYSAIYNGQVYNLEVLEIHKESKTITLSINGITKIIELKDELDLRIEEMGFESAASKELKELQAPMPGLILDILVKEGEEINHGTNLLVLEAMKMENILKATQSRIVEKILIKKGDKVEKNQKLIEFQ